MRAFAILFGAVCLVALTGCATSQTGVVLETDRWDQTLRIGDELYQVTPETLLFGPDGYPIRLHQVPTLADPGIGVRYASRAEVEFRARQQGGRLLLDRLWVRPR